MIIAVIIKHKFEARRKGTVVPFARPELHPSRVVVVLEKESKVIAVIAENALQALDTQ